MPEIPIYASKDLLDDRFPFKIEVRTPGYMNTLPHAHEHLQLCYLMSGSCFHWINGRSYVLTKGDLFSIPPFQEHRLELRENMDFHMLQVDFMPHAVNESLREWEDMPDFFDFAYIRPLISRDDVIPKLPLPPAEQAQVESLLHSIWREWQEQAEGYRLAIKAELLKLLVVTGRQYARYSQTQDQHGQHYVAAHREAFRIAIRYITDHYSEELHLDDIAAIALMSPSYFSSMLRLVTGKSYIELLSSLRIQAAMRLLRTTGLSVTEIAMQSGYNHIGHFNKMFKKHTGLTPGDYRKHPG